MTAKNTKKTKANRSQNPIKLWQEEFGAEYAPPAPVIAQVQQGTLNDCSWHNDIAPSFCPSWDDGSTLRLWSDAIKKSDRECGGSRYTLHLYKEGDFIREILTTDCVTTALYAFEIAELALRPDDQYVATKWGAK